MSSLRDGIEAPERRQSKDYWRSLERLLDSPALREAPDERSRHDEFAAGASDAPDGVDRRTMLTLMGASFALAGLEGCRRPVETIVSAAGSNFFPRLRAMISRLSGSISVIPISTKNSSRRSL